MFNALLAKVLVILLALFGISGVTLAQGRFGVNEPQRVVDLCEIDPKACDAAFLRARDHNWRVAPLCVLDPCACSRCNSLAWERVVGTESLSAAENALSESLKAGSLELVGANPIIVSPAPAYDGLLGERTSKAAINEGTPIFRLNRQALEASARHDHREGRICSASSSRPADVWHELTVRRNETRQCSSAAELVLDQRDVLGAAKYIAIIAGTRSRDQEKSAFKLFDDYKEQCLYTLSEYSTSSSLGALLGSNFTATARSSIGRLSRLGEPVYCTAAIAKRADQSIGLITAAHCIGDVTRGAGDGRLQYAANNSKMLFTSFDGAEYLVEIDEDVIGYDYAASDDSAFIPLTEGGVLSVTPFEIGKTPELWSPLYIVGANPFLSALAKAKDPEGYNAFSAASISLEAGCRVYGISDRSAFHNCQTEKSMSGSPIFVSRAGRAELVAVQSGEASSPKVPECGDGSAAAANVGTLVAP